MTITGDDGLLDLQGRIAPPSHYILKIESFSLLSKASIKIFISDIFVAEGYTWRLLIDRSTNGEDHISIYLELVAASSLSAAWEVNVISNFFIFNYMKNKYYSYGDGSLTRYHSMNPIFGIKKFMDLKTFSDSRNGYLLNDTCIFGVEIFIVKNTCKEERLSMMQEPITYYHAWKVTNFSSLVDDEYVSESFGCYKWKISLYPNGYSDSKGNSISIFLDVCHSSIPQGRKLYVKYLLRVKDLLHGKHIEHEGHDLYSLADKSSPGEYQFLSLAKLTDKRQGYLVDDTLVIEAEITLLGLVQTKS